MHVVNEHTYIAAKRKNGFGQALEYKIITNKPFLDYIKILILFYCQYKGSSEGFTYSRYLI